MPQVTSSFLQLPKSIQAVVKLIIEQLHPDAVLLFGSRARADYRENSDFDLAVKSSQISPQAWAKVRVSIDEDPLTLYPVDLVHFEKMTPDYQSRILAEGKDLYVR